ncbi:uncharacterized protein LOC112058030 [Bicyclus anynana]|uniref:Uncharacterized protein LOC112058030 n=1 Tax=Bicyclus anynana TaxID=110368 RepID=A0ABM3LXX0_BICAN|nr:uncharacterized protein LOC112058030 [Bicyclus anynana]
MKAIIVVFLLGVVAIVASQRVHVVDQNPEVVNVVDRNDAVVNVVDRNDAVESRAGGFVDTVRNEVASLRSRVRDRTNRVLSALGVNVVDHNNPPPTPVKVVDNINGVNVVDNSGYPSPGIIGNVDSGFYQPGVNQDIDPGFNRPSRPNIRPPKRK